VKDEDWINKNEEIEAWRVDVWLRQQWGVSMKRRGRKVRKKSVKRKLKPDLLF